MSWVPLHLRPDDEPGSQVVRTDVVADGRRVGVLLDTGGARTVLPEALFGGYRVVGHSRGNGVFGPSASPRIRLESLRFGGIEHGPLVVERGAPQAPCLVGLDVLSRHVLHLDLDGGRLGLDEGGHVGPARRLTLGQAGHPHLELHWGDADGYAVLDTGASVTVVDPRFAHAHPQLLTPIGETSSGTDSSGARRPGGQVWSLTGPVIGGLSFDAGTAVVVDLGFVNAGTRRPVDLIAGYPLLRQAVWTLDLPGALWSARPSGC